MSLQNNDMWINAGRNGSGKTKAREDRGLY